MYKKKKSYSLLAWIHSLKMKFGRENLSKKEENDSE